MTTSKEGKPPMKYKNASSNSLQRALLGGLAFSMLAALPATAITPKEIIKKSEQVMRGDTMQGTMEMLIVKPTYQRKMVMQIWQDTKSNQFLSRVISPAKEKGTGSLKIDKSMWNYLPKVEKVMKIPPSLMMQPWMGSDFTNDDMVQEVSLEDDYQQKLLGEAKVNGVSAYQLELIPNPDVPVVWGKLHYYVNKTNFLPVKQDFFDEKGKLVKYMSFSNVKKMHDRLIPTRMEMVPVTKKGHKTVLTYLDLQYDVKIPADTFSLRNLKDAK